MLATSLVSKNEPSGLVRVSDQGPLACSGRGGYCLGQARKRVGWLQTLDVQTNAATGLGRACEA